MFTDPNFWKGRLRAAGIHLGISLTLALIAALLVFLVWYPYPYSEISGGRNLFVLLISVDVIMGPLMTLAVFNLGKPRKELMRDLAVIGLLQLAALGYGLWTVAVARPVHLVFEIYRVSVVHAIDVPTELLDRAPPELRKLPWSGPTIISARGFKDEQEKTDMTLAALGGVSIAARPELWQSYAQARPQILASMKPLADLKTRFPARVADIDKALKSAGASARPAGSVSYLPMVGRARFWTALLDTQTTEVIAFVAVDSF